MHRAAQELRQSAQERHPRRRARRVITMDGEGHIVEFNPAAERTFGYTRGPRRPAARVDDLIVPPRRSGRRGSAALGLAVLSRARAAALRGGSSGRPARRRDGVPGRGLDHAHPRAPARRSSRRSCGTSRSASKPRKRCARTRDELQRRVEVRTAELKEANERLVDWVEELQQRAQDMRQLSEMGDHLPGLPHRGGGLRGHRPVRAAPVSRRAGALCMLDDGR